MSCSGKPNTHVLTTIELNKSGGGGRRMRVSGGRRSCGVRRWAGFGETTDGLIDCYNVEIAEPRLDTDSGTRGPITPIDRQ